MLPFKILASALPLMVAGLLAHGEWAPAPRPCIRLGDTSVQIAAGPWQAQRNVSFTDNPALATVRVQIVDGAEAADFAYVDDIDGTEAGACDVTSATLLIAIAASPAAAQPVIYLSQDGDADYRVFVSSKHFTAREAAALIVGASAGHAGIASATL
jgi:hypothetical protein